MRGEDGVLGHFAQGIVEAEAVVFHPLANDFERGKHAVTFVQMVHAGRDAQGRQGANAADAQHQLLANAGAMVSAVEPAGQLAVFGAVALDIAVEQV